MILLALQAALGMLLLALAAAGAGFPPFRRLGSAFHPWERLAFCLLGGWGVFSLALYLIGQVLFSRWIIFVVTFGFAALGSRFLWGVWRHRELSGPWMEKRALLPAAIVIFLLLVTTIADLAPVVGDLGSDTVAYHLLGPKVWLRAGVIRPAADNCHTAFPKPPRRCMRPFSQLEDRRRLASRIFLLLDCFSRCPHHLRCAAAWMRRVGGGSRRSSPPCPQCFGERISHSWTGYMQRFFSPWRALHWTQRIRSSGRRSESFAGC